MKKVLIIDDEPSIAEIVNLFCMQIGYSADAVHSGRSAMEKIRNNPYWAVFCDLQMPGLNGMEIYDKVKEVKADLSGKFVLLTGAMLDQEMEATVAEQKIKVLQKPFHFDGIRKLFSELEV
jgi:two-component system nitrogen regulation response regulator GlnG